MTINPHITLFYGAKPVIFERAKVLRKNMTRSEKILWERLREKKMLGLRFRSQHPIDVFIVDFYCHALKLVIEIDGAYHLSIDQKEYDIGREFELNEWGIEVIRFTNRQIEENIEKVMSEIRCRCCSLDPSLD